MTWRDVVFQYDGTFEGFLCCVFESYVNKEFPIAFPAMRNVGRCMMFAMW